MNLCILGCKPFISSFLYKGILNYTQDLLTLQLLHVVLFCNVGLYNNYCNNLSMASADELSDFFHLEWSLFVYTSLIKSSFSANCQFSL